MTNSRRKLYSQNFLCSRKLVSSLVGNSSIEKNDLVVDIGAGQGIITAELLERGANVIAIEIDTYWYSHLHSRFPNQPNLTLVHADFLSWPLPQNSYKVFANLPFSVEGLIIRKLLDAPHPPQDCYLIIMDKFARRLTTDHNLFSSLYTPWFEFNIIRYVSRYSFRPVPSIDAALFHFSKRQRPLLDWSHRHTYQQFVRRAFGNGQSVYRNLSHYHPKNRIDRIFHNLSLNHHLKPSHLSPTTWINLHRTLTKISN